MASLSSDNWHPDGIYVIERPRRCLGHNELEIRRQGHVITHQSLLSRHRGPPHPVPHHRLVVWRRVLVPEYRAQRPGSARSPRAVGASPTRARTRACPGVFVSFILDTGYDESCSLRANVACLSLALLRLLPSLLTIPHRGGRAQCRTQRRPPSWQHTPPGPAPNSTQLVVA